VASKSVTAPVETPASRRRPAALKAPSDPGHAALRRAARAAIVIPLAFAFGQFVLRDAQNIIFIVFGGFALLVMSDFGGLRRARATAYLGATLVGAVLIALGTVVSQNVALAGATMLLVGFVISFASVFGGYIAAAQTGLLLAFVISIMVPAPAGAVPARVAGWTVAGILATLAAVALWPRFERIKLHKAAAKACLAVANLVEGLGRGAPDRDLPPLLEVARRAEAEARQQYAATAKRPAGPTRRDRAFVQLLIELQQIVDIVVHPFEQTLTAAAPGIDETDRLVTATVAALRSSADVLTGGAPPDLRAVEENRERQRSALDRWASEQLRAGRPADEVLGGLDVDHTLRVVSYLSLSLGSNAVIAAGGRPEEEIALPVSAPRLEGVSGTTTRVGRAIRTHLAPSSTVLQRSLRVAVGLALAVWVARSLGLSHAFWVVLGTLQVLRSTALGTGRTTIQALAGNVIGVVIGGVFAVLAGNHPAVMWVALPLAVFLAAYAATTVGFIASQAAFTINLIIIFNLISPAGWQVGLVRIEDVAIGASISVLVGLLLWPRGARREFARALGGFYRAAANYLQAAFDRVLDFEPPASLEPSRRVAIQARERAGEAFDAFLNERVASPLDAQTAGLLLSEGNHAMLAAELLDVVAGRMGYRAGGCADGARAVHTQEAIMIDGLITLADRLALEDRVAAQERISREALRTAARDCLRRWRNDDRAGRGAMAVVIAGEWVENIARLEADLERPVTVAVEAARTPWWR
jgi:uncharacterized membrane protein YccC